VRTTKPKAAAAARIGAGVGGRKRAGLLELLELRFVRTQTWLQAGKYVSALLSELPRRNGWTIAQHAGDRTPNRTQRLLNRAAWDTFAAMSQVRRFVAADLDAAARRNRRRGGMVIGAIDETGQEKAGEATAGVKRQYMGARAGWQTGSTRSTCRTCGPGPGTRRSAPGSGSRKSTSRTRSSPWSWGCRTRGAAKVHAIRLAWETAAA
jgi:DDE superfamily endonuclease